MKGDDGPLQQKSQEYLLKHISDSVENSGNPDLAKAILFSTHEESSLYLERAPISLGVQEEEFMKVISSLQSSAILRIYHDEREGENHKFDKLMNNDGVQDYLKSDIPFGPYNIIGAQGISRGTTLRVMESVLDLVNFSYSKRFDLSVKDFAKLRSLKELSEKTLASVRKNEEDFWHTELGIPSQYNQGFNYFARIGDFTRRDGYDVTVFSLEGKFNSPSKAFEIGFDNAGGTPLASKNYGERIGNRLPAALDIQSQEGKYRIRLENIALKSQRWGEAWIPSLEYRLEAKKVGSELKERIEKALNGNN